MSTATKFREIIDFISLTQPTVHTNQTTNKGASEKRKQITWSNKYSTWRKLTFAKLLLVAARWETTSVREERRPCSQIWVRIQDVNTK